jgi:hypothetical protein
MPESKGVVDSHVAADTEGKQELLFIALVAVMDQQARARATPAASESVALQYAISQSTEQSQRTILPVVTRTTAPQSFQLNRPCPAQAKEGKLTRLV